MKKGIKDWARYYTLRRSVLRELFHLPPYLWGIHRVSTAQLQEERLPYGDHPLQYALLERPTDRPPRGWIIYFHGGAWRFGQPERFRAAAAIFAEFGFGTILPSYRRTPKYQWPDIREDLVCLLRTLSHWFQIGEEEVGSFAVGGMSAGGLLAAHLALDPTIPEAADWRYGLPKAVVCCASVLDLQSMYPDFVIHDFCGPASSSTFQAANPIEHLSPGYAPPPFLLIHGTDDGMAPFQNCRAFFERFQTHFPDRVHLYPIERGSHLDAGRWMYQNNSERAVLDQFLNQLP